MSDKIRVIIVDDIAETRENFRKLLQFETDIEVVGTARTGREGIQIAKDVQPDVVLMDINMPDMDGISATEIIRKEVPHSQIVILSVQGDPNYMRRAMLAGARDFLTKPPMVDELISAIRRAGAMAHEERAKAARQWSLDRGDIADHGHDHIHHAFYHLLNLGILHSRIELVLVFHDLVDLFPNGGFIHRPHAIHKGHNHADKSRH